MRIQIGLISNKHHIDHPGTWLAGLIQWIRGSWWNHLVIILHFAERSVVIHAQLWVRLEEYEDWKQKADRLVALYDPVHDLSARVSWLMQQLNKWYDILGLLLFGWAMLTKHWPKYLEHKQEKRWFCSELGASFLGIPQPTRQSPDSVAEYTQFLRFNRLMMTKKGVGEVQAAQAVAA